MTDAEVAERLGLSQPRYARYVTDKREPDFELLVRICNLLDITPNDLLLDGGPEKPGDVELDRAVVALKGMESPLRQVVVDMVVAAQKKAAKQGKTAN
ncbi:helix-turn-helix protein [Nitrospirillum pindoramense]|uniref:Helix-turn-helix protein n=1 Tax=Nitrospirillum amazonense TaxID=28077 RepID=A0A560H8D7_9PROT|nr:helix-turn-helix protein [Nitrospirillum amazonense]